MQQYCRTRVEDPEGKEKREAWGVFLVRFFAGGASYRLLCLSTHNTICCTFVYLTDGSSIFVYSVVFGFGLAFLHVII